MKNDTKYNGWTNKETWYIHMVYQDIFANMTEEQEFDDMGHMAHAFELLVDELEFENLQEGSLARQAVGTYLHAVNWTEIAGHFFKEEEEAHDYASEMRCQVGAHLAE
jgi:hypothetical protein